MDPLEAMLETDDPDEREALSDDFLLHANQDEGTIEEPEPEPDNEIEKPPPPKPKPKEKKPRTKAQHEAFKKAREALAAKRLQQKKQKDEAPKPRRGRPPTTASTTSK